MADLKVRILAEVEQVDKLSQKFKILSTGAKEADYAFRQGKISADALKDTLSTLRTKGESLNGTYKQMVDLNATLYQVQARADVGFKSLGKSLDDLKGNVQRTNPAFVSFNQIVQDAPFGIRGVGNNIQFLTQQFTQLRTQGMTTGEILKGMMHNALTPMGALMFAVSAGTSLLTVAMDHLGKKTADTAEETVKLNKHLEDLSKDELVRTYKQLQAQLKWFEMQATIEEIKLSFTSKPIIDPQSGAIIGYEAQADRVKTVSDKFKNHRDELKKTLGEIEDIIYGKEKDENKKGKFPLRSLSTGLLDVGFDAGSMSGIGAYNPNALSQWMSQNTGGGTDPRKKAVDARNREIDEEEKALKATEESLRNAMNIYNSVFFDPLKAGFNAIATGSKSMADAFIESIKQMVIQLLSFAAYSAILNLLMPGAGGFGAIFGKVSGLSGVLPTEVVPKATRSIGGLANSVGRNTSNKMQIQLVGKLKGQDIFIAGNRAMAMESASNF